MIFPTDLLPAGQTSVKQQGTFQASHEYRVPEELRSLRVRLPPAATVTDKSGFSHAGNRTYEWTGARTAVSLTYRMPANRSHDDGDLRAVSDEYAFVDAGEWAIVASDLDRRLRLASDGERSLQTVLRRLNAREQPATAETFVALLGSVGDGSVAAAGSLYTMTTERPSPSLSPFPGPGS